MLSMGSNNKVIRSGFLPDYLCLSLGATAARRGQCILTAIILLVVLWLIDTKVSIIVVRLGAKRSVSDLKLYSSLTSWLSFIF